MTKSISPGWAFRLGSGLFIWAAHFACGYLLASLVCTRGFADRRVGGLPLVTLGTTLASLVAIAACALVLYNALTALRAAAAAGDETQRLLHFMTGAITVIALAGIAWTAMSGLVPRVCAPV
jgi:hypothetical protein